MPCLIKISENEYRLSGDINACYETIKKVTVDGVEYSRTERTEKIFSYDNDFNSSEIHFDWSKIEVDDFAFLGIKNIIIWDYRWRYGTGIDSIAPYNCKFTDGSVNILKLLFHLKILDSRVTDVYTSKKQTWQTHVDKDKSVMRLLYHNQEIDIHIKDYGFQNSHYCTISLRTFLSLDMSLFKCHKYKSLHKVIPEILTTKNFMSEKTRLIVSFRIFESQIKYIENENINEQRAVLAYM